MFLFGCGDGQPDVPTVPPLVVEGWIEEGESPVVMVTRAVDMTQDVESFDTMVEKWCRVSVFDNGKRYLLTGKSDSSYTPPFVFTTSSLRGKSGHTYVLRVETETDTVEGTATLPPAVMIDKLEPEKIAGSDSLYSIKATLRNVEPAGYYKFFVKTIGKDNRFYPSFLGTFSGADYDTASGFNITKGIHAGYEGDEFSHYFSAGDKVTVKICSMERNVFEFWKTYDSNVSLSGNLFFTFTENCPHTVIGGIGYWGAYGMSRRSIEVR